MERLQCNSAMLPKILTSFNQHDIGKFTQDQPKYVFSRDKLHAIQARACDVEPKKSLRGEAKPLHHE